MSTDQTVIYLVAGMNRSGSTWLYNVLRHLLRRRHPDLYARGIEEYEPADPASAHLVKVHDRPSPSHPAILNLSQRAQLVFTSRRAVTVPRTTGPGTRCQTRCQTRRRPRPLRLSRPPSPCPGRAPRARRSSPGAMGWRRRPIHSTRACRR